MTAATMQAAVLLADAWQPALAAEYRRGYLDGCEAGRREAEREAAGSWALAATQVRDTLAAPRREKLEAHRRPDNRPCPERCERCSRCIRAAAVAANLRRWGTLDYPPAEVRAAIIAGGAA